jgi:hypothetical protein
VLSAPRVEFIPPTVAFVASPDDGACEGATSDRTVSGSVDIVGAVDLLPIVGGGCSSSEDRAEPPAWFNEGVLIQTPVGPVEKEPCPFPFGIELCPLTCPDSGYGLFFLRFAIRFELDFDWLALRFVGDEVEASLEELLNPVSFFIHVENGRRRPARSAVCHHISSAQNQSIVM